MTCDATVDLYPLYLPKHSAPAARVARPSVSPVPGTDWTRRVLPAVRFAGGLLLDLLTAVVTFVVFLLLGSGAVDLYLQWRH